MKNKTKNNKKNNSIIITDLNQLLSMTANQAKNIKSFYFKNQIIDNTFFNHLLKLSLVNLDSFYFIECVFNEPNILSAIIYSKNVGFVNCELSFEEISTMLEWIKDWKEMDTLDLSGNNLGRKQIEFFKWLNMNIWCHVYIKNFIISDNNFSADFKVRMLEHNEWFKSFDNISL